MTEPTRREALIALRDKVQAGARWGGDTDFAAAAVFDLRPGQWCEEYGVFELAYGRSVDGAIAFHGAMLCRIDPQYGYLIGAQYARIVHPSGGVVCDATAPVPAHALLIATLTALIELEPRP
jgi:hypothetical protein